MHYNKCKPNKNLMKDYKLLHELQEWCELLMHGPTPSKEDINCFSSRSSFSRDYPVAHNSITITASQPTTHTPFHSHPPYSQCSYFISLSSQHFSSQLQLHLAQKSSSLHSSSSSPFSSLPVKLPLFYLFQTLLLSQIHFGFG